MDRYALDANAIAADFRFRGVPARLLLREARSGNIGILVPRIALEEAVNLYREVAEGELRAVRKAERRLQALGVATGGVLIEPPDVASLTSAYEQELTETLASAGATILPYPDIGHHVVARRAMERRRPFDAAGRDGYRDTLLWESLLAVAADDSAIVLVSADDRAFSPKSSVDLLPELKTELEARGLAADAIRRIRRISDFTDTLASIPVLQVAAEHWIATRADIRDAIEDSVVEEALDFDQSNTSVIGLPLRVAHLYYHEVHAVTNMAVRAARDLEGDLVGVDLTADMYATMEVHVDPPAAAAYIGTDARFERGVDEDGYVVGYVGRTVQTEIYAIFEKRAELIRRIDVYNFIPVAELPPDFG
jgi:hypothetical protein